MPTFRVSNDPELLAGETDVPGATSQTAKSATASQAKPTAGQQESGGNGDDVAVQDGRAASLRERRDVVVEWLKVLKAAPGKGAPVVQKLAPLVQQCDQALKAGDLDEAEKKLVWGGKLPLSWPLAASEKSPTPTATTTPPATTRGSPSCRLRRGVIMDWLKEPQGRARQVAPSCKSLAPSCSSGDQALNAGDLNGAEKKLVLLENYHQLAAKTAEKTNEPEESEIDPAEALREHTEQAAQLPPTRKIKEPKPNCSRSTTTNSAANSPA